MKLFSRHTESHIEPLWRYDAGTMLWRIIPDNAGHIVGEARDPVSRTASFFCLRERDGSPLWQGRRLDQDWWIGIEEVSNGMILFHGYVKPDMPQHIGIIACDVVTGEEIWRETELSYVFQLDASIYAAEQRFSAMVFHRLDAASGERLEVLGSDASAINELRASLNEDDAFVGYDYPEPYTPSHPEWVHGCALVEGMLDPAAVVGNLDVLERGNLIFAAWHQAKDDGGLAQHFIIRNADSGALRYRETLIDHADAPGMDSFFIKDDLLLYVRNRSMLVAHQVAGIDT